LAATNRILAYSKGLVSNDVAVDVLMPHPTDKFINELKLPNEGKYQDVSYKYVVNRYKNKFKIIRGLLHSFGIRSLIGYIFTAFEIITRNRQNSYDAIIISNDRIFFLFYYSLVAKLVGAKAIFIFDEYPTPIRHKLKTKIPLLKKLMYKFVLKTVNGYVSISNELKIFYTNLCNRSTFVLPIIIDISKFELKIHHITNPQKGYICYMGNMELSKDNVDNIIDSFSEIAHTYPLVDLHLYGRPNKQNFNYLSNLVKKFKLENRIIFKSKVANDKVPEILQKAIALVSSQPDTVRASGGFPTKLGEYLASGVPTLLTDVGENSKYVKDNVHLYFVPPSNPELYSEKLNYILSNYSEAKKVALNGKSFIEENYSYKTLGKNLKEFIQSI
jgi:glycosyltransferase involved in cell wall biosynthesis